MGVGAAVLPPPTTNLAHEHAAAELPLFLCVEHVGEAEIGQQRRFIIHVVGHSRRPREVVRCEHKYRRVS